MLSLWQVISLSSSFNLIMQVPKILFVALVSHAFLKSASAAVEVFTTLATWEARVAAAAVTQCISIDDFSGPNIPLITGTTDVGLFDVTTDLGNPFLGQRNGSYTGQVFNPNTQAPMVLNFHNFDNAPIIAVAGDWSSTTTGASLTVTINGQLIKFSDHLTGSGNGFLGFVDEAGGIATLTFGTEGTPSSAAELFTLDDLNAAGRCPACPNGGCQGDPHFKTWRGHHFDYQGNVISFSSRAKSSSPAWALTSTSARRSAMDSRTFPVLLSGLAMTFSKSKVKESTG
jgi:hypothetical protein